MPTQQIKLIHANKASINDTLNDHYEVQAIIAHKGTPGDYKYLVHWLGYNDPTMNTWQPASDFDYKLHIELYWARRNSGNNVKILPTTVNNTIRKRANRDKHSNKNARVITRSQKLLLSQKTSK